MSDTLVVVGVLARIELECAPEVRAGLEALAAVSVFDLPPDPDGREVEGGRIGVLIEAPSVDRAHEILRQQVDAVPGVLGTWPISVESEDGFDARAAECAG